MLFRSELSLARIVEAYLAEVERMQALDLEVATEFLLIAATLLEFKARRLLPGRDGIDLDEELALWEERDLLLARLLDCKTFKDVAAAFQDLVERADRSYPRAAGPDERFAELMPDLLEGVSLRRLQRAYLRATAPKPPTVIAFEHVAPIRASVADALVEVTATAQLSRDYLAVLRVDDLLNERPETRAGYYAPGRVVMLVLQGQWQ